MAWVSIYLRADGQLSGAAANLYIASKMHMQAGVRVGVHEEMDFGCVWTFPPNELQEPSCSTLFSRICAVTEVM